MPPPLPRRPHLMPIVPAIVSRCFMQPTPVTHAVRGWSLRVTTSSRTYGKHRSSWSALNDIRWTVVTLPHSPCPQRCQARKQATRVLPGSHWQQPVQAGHAGYNLGTLVREFDCLFFATVNSVGVGCRRASVICEMTRYHNPPTGKAFACASIGTMLILVLVTLLFLNKLRPII